MVRYSLSCMTLSFTTPRRFIPTHHEADPKPSTFAKERLKVMSTHGSATAQEETPHVNENNSIEEKIEALAEIICGGGDESAAALFVLMGTMQNSDEPEVLANTVKH